MKDFCPNCEKEIEIRFIRCKEEFEIRGETINVEVEYYQCEECGEDFEIPRPGYDPLDAAYREYRRRKGMLQPEQIKEFRLELGLTQKEMSQVLGIGIASLNRYENGALQSEAQDRLIQTLMQPENLIQFLESHPDLLSTQTRQRVFAALRGDDDSAAILLKEVIETFGSYPPTIMSGYKRLDSDKFFETIKLLCYPEGVVKTKLNKLLFYVDFKYFKDHAVSITGMRYAHATHGPIPDEFETWLTALSDWRKEIVVDEQLFGDYLGEVYISGPPDRSLFELSELECIASVKEKFRAYNAAQIKQYSHQEKGYQQTRNGELISYAHAAELSI